MDRQHEILTLTEAAEFLRISPETLRDLACRGQIPGRLVGNDWRFPRSKLVEWLAAAEPDAGTADAVWERDMAGTLAERLAYLETDVPDDERRKWLEAMARAAKPARYVPGRGLVIEE